MRAEIDQRVEV